MSWYIANEEGLIDQFASGLGLAQLTDAAAKYPALSAFFKLGATKDIDLCRAELRNLASITKDSSIKKTATGLERLLQGQSLVSITQGTS